MPESDHRRCKRTCCELSNEILPITILLIYSLAKAGVGMTAFQLPFDIRFAWSGAKLSFPFVRRGIVPEGMQQKLKPCSASLTLMIRNLQFPPTPSHRTVTSNIAPSNRRNCDPSLSSDQRLVS